MANVSLTSSNANTSLRRDKTAQRRRQCGSHEKEGAKGKIGKRPKCARLYTHSEHQIWTRQKVHRIVGLLRRVLMSV